MMKLRNVKINATVDFIQDEKGLRAVGSRQGLFIGFDRNYNGRTLWFSSKTDGNYVFKALKEMGWEVVEKAAAAPRNKILWCKEGRRIFATEKAKKQRELTIAADICHKKGEERLEAVRKMLDDLNSYMKIWEAENATAINEWLVANGHYTKGA